MLRIQRVGETTTEIVLKLEGRIAYEEGLLLRAECARWQRRFSSIVLDLSDVTLVDPTGIRILRHKACKVKGVKGPPTAQHCTRQALGFPSFSGATGHFRGDGNDR